MLLKSVQISNFRSIKNETIQFSNSCMILVGKNEAGKSNILKAVAGGLSKEAYPFSAKDKRKILPSEARPSEEEYFVRYYFDLSKRDIKYIVQKITRGSFESIIMQDKKTYSLFEYCCEFYSSIIYNCNISTNKIETYSQSEVSSPQRRFDLIRPVFRVLDSIKTDTGNLNVNDIVDFRNEEHVNFFQEIDNQEFYEIIRNEFLSFFETNVPRVVYWKYSEALLLPDTIPISSFRTSQTLSIPLSNIFDLAGYKNIDQAFQAAKASDGDFENLLDRVSEISTKQFIQKWPDLKRIKIVLAPDGDLIRIKIQEKAKYNFSDRSDGFKRFISILLMLSTQVVTGKISNSLIIIDEPDNSLYPSGSRYLRDELIKIAEKNIVLYSTHSPFMIDRERIRRHLIVSKNDDITTIKETEACRFAEDEVLLNAIGTSIFEFLKTNNLLFEGWTDHRIFCVALSNKKASLKPLISKFGNIGTAYVHGVQSFKLVAPIVQLAKKNIFILSDADSAALSAREAYRRDNGYQYHNWYTIKDLGGYENYTIEDYLEDEFLQKGVDIILGEGVKDIKDKAERPVMQFLINLSKDQRDALKKYYSDNVTVTDIKLTYYQLLENLIEQIQQSVISEE